MSDDPPSARKEPSPHASSASDAAEARGERRVLITGGAGFIGSHLAERLLNDDPTTRLTILDDLSTGRASNLDRLTAARPERVRFIRGAVGETLPSLEGEVFHAVYHLAAAVGVRLILEQPIHTIETNVLETARLLDFAERAGGAPVLIASSSEVYGKSTAVPFNEAQDVVYGSTKYTRWSYACTKAIDEYLALAHHRQRGLPVVIARFFNTVGPGQIGDYGMVLPRLIHAALRDEPLRVYGDGRQVRCFCDVRDVVGVLPRLVENAACHGELFNIGSDVPITIRRLAELVIETLGSKSSIAFVPYEEAYAAGFEDLAVRQPDLTRLRAAVGFEPRISLGQTILDIAAAMRRAEA